MILGGMARPTGWGYHWLCDFILQLVFIKWNVVGGGGEGWGDVFDASVADALSVKGDEISLFPRRRVPSCCFSISVSEI